MHWTDKASAKAQIAEELLKLPSWKVYGYRADKSEAMYDYFDPAHWWGVAVKDECTLVVGSYKPYDLSGEGCPVYQANPEGSSWHIEKDGKIILKPGEKIKFG